MRYLLGLMCVSALGMVPLFGCGETGGDGESEDCADWAGEWIVSSLSCDGVAEELPSVAFAFTADCNGEMLLTQNTTCQSTMQMTFMAEAGDATIFDAGAITCSPRLWGRM